MVETADGDAIASERLLVATGIGPRTEGIGLGNLGLTEGDPIDTDRRGRVPGHRALWAIGDVTGVAPYTHTANYQARAVAANICGGDVELDYRAIPRCVYTEPPVASVGMVTTEAEDAGIDSAVERFDVGETARAASEGRSRGCLVLVADRSAGVLVGASAMGPRADEWIGEATLAIRARVPLAVLADVVQSFPDVLRGLRAGIAPPGRSMTPPVLLDASKRLHTL